MDATLTPPLAIGLADFWTRVKRSLHRTLKDYIVFMGGFSNTAELEVLDATTGGTAYGGVTPLKLSLVTVAVTDSDDATTITKANYTGYADINVANADWNAASAGAKTNVNALAFAACTAGSSSVIGFALWRSSDNKILMYGTTATLAVSAGITPSFAAGALSLGLD